MKKFVSILAAICILMTIVIIPASAADAYVSTAAAKPDHLVLSWASDPTTTMTLTWRTATSVTKTIVEYQAGSSLTSGTKLTGPDATPYTVEAGNDKSAENIHRATVTGLTPGTTYAYRVGDGTNWSAASTFTTEAANTTNFQFFVFGDAQCAKELYVPWKTTLTNATAKFPNAKFMINLGDTSELGGSGPYWDQFFSTSADVMAKLPEMIVQGNHDCFTASFGYTMPTGVRAQFTTPSNGPKTADGLEKTCYSYDYGNVHFVVLDSQVAEENFVSKTDILAPQVAWLENDLAAHKNAQFTIVTMHKCIYYNNSTRANSELKAFIPVFDKYHVDLVLNGHDHEYARTYPMVNDSPVAKNGTVYITCGRSGEKTYVNANRKYWDAFYYDAQVSPTYNVISVNGAKLTFDAYLQDGTLLDTYTIDKAGTGTSLNGSPCKYSYTRLAVCGDLLQTPELSTPPALTNGVYYIPVRSVVQHLGASVTWNGADSSITIAGLAKPAVIKIGSADATVGGAPVTLKYPVIANAKGITMMAIDDVASVMSLASQTVFGVPPLPITARYDAALNMVVLDD